MPPQINNSFDAANVQLQDANLIEASAGTGKTYSIALMALRLILEEEISVNQILMVTFTNDAAAEMELRLRDFVRDALTVARTGGGIKDPLITRIVNQVRQEKDAITILQRALAQFDKASIYTIHGFCARVLKEFAFECRQIFQSATLEPDQFEQYFNEAFNQAWREKVTTLSQEKIRILNKKKELRKILSALVKGHLMGKSIYIPSGMDVDYDEIMILFNKLERKEDLLWQEVVNRMEDWRRNAVNNNNNAFIRNILPLLKEGNKEGLLGAIKKNFSTTYCKNFFETGVLALAKEVNTLNKLLNERVALVVNTIALECAEYVQERLINQLGIEGRITFDDMITFLHSAVCKNSQEDNPLADKLRTRYRAVFIDEFQDTDQMQYEIFSALFNDRTVRSGHILFYIGDPKQSIYAFRKADLYTYFRAENEVDAVYRMNTNYRSTDQYIEAMNVLFQPTPGFDVFISSQMQYHPVAAPAQNKKQGGLAFSGRLLEPMRIIGCEKKDYIYDQTLLLLKNLLYNKDFTFYNGETFPQIEASQIGILVRSNKDGSRLRKMIAKEGIPVITVGDEKIFQSSVARDLYYILDAAQNITRVSMNRALLTTIAGISWAEVLLLDEERLYQQFRSYHDLWKTKGVYVFLRTFLQDVRAVQRKADGTMPNADRILADYFQLMEMLHEEETAKKLIPAELINRLKKSIEGETKEGDQHLQRIESDEKAVKIVTIHSSKGLEYDIVIAPFLDIQLRNNPDTYQLYENNQYYTADADLLFDTAEQAAKTQLQQENMRLLYVAITRARYHCYIMSAKSAYATSSLNRLFTKFLTQNQRTDYIKLIAAQLMSDTFMNNVNLEENAPELIYIGSIPPQAAASQRQAGESIKIPENRIPDLYWQKTSYSSLNLKREPFYKQKTDVGSDTYDKFIFNEIRSGAQAGNFLHEILERIDFSDKSGWERKVVSAIKRYPGIITTTDHAENKIIELLQHVVQVDLKDGDKVFNLNQVNFDTRINELEFDLPLTDIDFSLLPETVDEGKIPLRLKRSEGLTGILNGKIDLFFEHEGRYYIVDWKSNHLGNQSEAYHQEAMAMAMEENNYYLQYYLYSLAMYRYLKLRLKDFDYDTHFGGVYYLFLRGIREGQPYGIYSHRPKKQDLDMLEEFMLMRV